MYIRDSDYRGVVNVSRENLVSMARTANKLGWQMTSHTTGGGAIDLLLEAYEEAIALGNTGAMVSLGRMVGAGDGVPVDFARAEKLLEDAIAGGAAKEGWAALAVLYASADEAHRDLARAAAFRHG